MGRNLTRKLPLRHAASVNNSLQTSSLCWWLPRATSLHLLPYDCLLQGLLYVFVYCFSFVIYPHFIAVSVYSLHTPEFTLGPHVSGILWSLSSVVYQHCFT